MKYWLNWMGILLGLGFASAIAFGQVDDPGQADDFGGGGGGGGTSVAVEDEAVLLTSAATKLNFEGAGVTATEPVGDEILVTIPGGTVFTGDLAGNELSDSLDGDVTIDVTDTLSWAGATVLDGYTTDGALCIESTGLNAELIEFGSGGPVFGKYGGNLAAWVSSARAGYESISASAFYVTAFVNNPVQTPIALMFANGSEGVLQLNKSVTGARSVEIRATHGVNFVSAAQIQWSSSATAFPTTLINGDIRINRENTGIFGLRATGTTAAATHTFHGEMYQEDNAVATVINTIDVWEEVTNFSVGHTNGYVFSSGTTLTATNSGLYDLKSSISSQSASTNQTLEFGISINDVVNAKCHSQRRYANSDEGAQAITCLLNLAASDVLKLEARNRTSTSNLTVTTANINMHQL